MFMASNLRVGGRCCWGRHEHSWFLELLHGTVVDILCQSSVLPQRAKAAQFAALHEAAPTHTITQTNYNRCGHAVTRGARITAKVPRLTGLIRPDASDCAKLGLGIAGVRHGSQIAAQGDD